MKQEKNIWEQSRVELFQKLDCRETGLSQEDAALRLVKYGANELHAGKQKSILQIFLGQFADFLVLILILAAVISACMGDVESMIVILAVITMNAILGTVQTVKASASLDSLKQMSAAECGKLNHPAFRIITNISPLVSVIRDSPCLNNFCSEFFKMRIVASDIQVGSKFGGLSRYDQHCKNKAKTQNDDFSSLSFHVVSPLCSFFAGNYFSASYPVYTTYTTA